MRLLLGLLLACSSSAIEVPEGFVAEEIYNVPNDKQGSWISLAADGKGKIYAGSERHGVFVFQEPAAGAMVADAQALMVDVKFGGVQGLHVGFGSLYVMNNAGDETAGLYRLKQDDTNWTASHILPLKGNGGHGLHAIIPHPDGKRLTINAGNAGHLPAEVPSSRVPKAWGEDQLLPRLPDSFGHSATLWAPGGWVANVNPDGSDFELLAAGFRNAFDVAYNQAGDLFTFDADMEWDMGTPWYRPTRVCHVMSGAEFGWRNGSGKWPAYYEDSLPAIGDIGPSSPTGVLSGLDTTFPTKYRDAIFICDWTYGLVYALHLKPSGGSYTMNKEVFASGKPFPVVDLILGSDGAMYGVTGGRNTHSSVWRIRYVGKDATAKPPKRADGATTTLRRQLEGLHKPNNGMVTEVWPHLNHPDRFIRFAARVVIEHNPVSQWRANVLAEKDPMRLAQGAIALAKHGTKPDAAPLLGALTKVPLAGQTETTQLALLRAASLCLIRLDQDAMHSQLAEWALPALSDVDSPVCREAARLLVRVGAPEATPKLVHLMQTAKSDLKVRDDLSSRDTRGHVGPTLAKMKKQPPPSSQMYYALLLRHAKSGWTPSGHLALAEWLVHAENQAGGRSYRGFLQRIRRDVLKHADNKTREIYTMAEAKRATVALKIVPPKGPGRAWTISDIETAMSKPLTGRDFENGKNMFAATLCAQCHQFQGEGGAVGPDLTQLGTRFSARDIAEAIIEPSKAIAEQYESIVFHVEGNETIVGRIASEDKREYEVMINPFDLSQTMPVRKKRVIKKAPSTTSLMPPALISALNEDELKDLFAYLISGGNAQDKMFK